MGWSVLTDSVLGSSDDEEEPPQTFRDHRALLITKAVDEADGSVEVKGLIFKHGTHGSEDGPAWYECLVRGPTGTVTIKESTDCDSFMDWLKEQTPETMGEMCPGAKIPTPDEVERELNVLLRKLAETKYSRTEYGAELATKVSEKLLSGTNLANSHSCGGVGLGFFEDKGFVMAGVLGGELMEGAQTIIPENYFVKWLAASSDFSFSGVVDPWQPAKLINAYALGNQRLTRARLEDFVASPDV
jgi:hypothetical protein